MDIRILRVSLKRYQLCNFVLLAKLGDHLYTCAAVADDTDSLALKVVRFRPFACVVNFTFEEFSAWNVWPILLAEKSKGCDEIMAGYYFASACLNDPDIAVFVVMCRKHLGVELHVWSEVVPLDDVFQVGKCLWLLDVVFIPVVGQKVFLVPAIAVDVA